MPFIQIGVIRYIRIQHFWGFFSAKGPHEKQKAPKKEVNPMPIRIKQLSSAKVRSAKPQESEYKMFDGGGLYLLVTPSGGKSWYLKYRFEGKEKKLSTSVYFVFFSPE